MLHHGQRARTAIHLLLLLLLCAPRPARSARCCRRQRFSAEQIEI
jgi:hypothetical protein